MSMHVIHWAVEAPDQQMMNSLMQHFRVATDLRRQTATATLQGLLALDDENSKRLATSERDFQDEPFRTMRKWRANVY